jgi:hypothetical protein
MNNYYERAGRLVEDEALQGKDSSQLSRNAHEALANLVMDLAPDADPSVVEAKIEQLIAELVRGFNTGGV